MVTLEQIQVLVAESGLEAADALLLPIESGLSGMPILKVDDEQAMRLRQGKRITQGQLLACELCCAIDMQGQLVALAEVDPAGEVRVRRGFAG
jgi:tRNA pseudouridine55 synthase